ncbi:MAG: FkbM family methyltransferase [Rhodospirillales bacterium]|jgi:FkbM family methyltransferase|nr:hypothetical protein [Rhodospirillaceae bacterium]MDP6428878.1 FkbM family methyltransferase [Rhodospirillales bacterium]MDP6644749.1 FkbM family methyltransferase [Rhodospirillales bacterium]MDP6840481.1 FkbM family methyltransferase [Rhodospirillales bacterium]|tara:strand:- start:950 stop:1759 length:810 start_codon:yes stop_codon:yes gene_type:complete
MFYKLWHYLHAVEFRLYLLNELSILRRQNKKFPANLWLSTLRRPTSTEDWINFLRFLAPGEPIHLIDVGANDGSWSEGFVSIFPNTRLTAFEPLPSTFELLRARFGMRDETQLHNCALSDESGRMTINLGQESTFASFEEFEDHIGEAREKHITGTEEVEVKTLDSVDIKHENGRRTVLKIDVQGHEEEVLEGAGALLPSVDLVLCEVSFASEYKNRPPSFARVSELLRPARLFPIGFQEFGRQASTYAIERDVLFVKDSLLERIFDNG